MKHIPSKQNDGQRKNLVRKAKFFLDKKRIARVCMEKSGNFSLLMKSFKFTRIDGQQGIMLQGYYQLSKPKHVKETLFVAFTSKKTLSMENCKGKLVDHVNWQVNLSR